MKYHIAEYDYAGDTWGFEIQAGDSIDDAKARLRAIGQTARLTTDPPRDESVHVGVHGFIARLLNRL